MKRIHKPHLFAGVALSAASTMQALVFNIQIEPVYQGMIGFACGMLVLFLGRDYAKQ